MGSACLTVDDLLRLFEIFESEKVAKFSNFRENLVEFLVLKCQ